MRIVPIASLLTAAMVLGGCASTTAPRASMPAASATGMSTGMATSGTLSAAIVNLASASGSLVSGKLSLMAMGDGVHITGEVGGLAPNSTHGFHIHEKGDCSAADASSAGGHFNPGSEPHGRARNAQHHAGDNDNLVANGQGVARIDAHFAGVVLGGGAGNDIVGKAVVVHGDPDDYTSQPSGNAGSRVACGVISGG